MFRVLLVVACLVGFSHGLYVKDEHYKRFLKESSCVVLHFTSPENPDSNRLLSVHQGASEELSQCLFRHVNVHDNPLMVHDFEVSHTPTVVMVREGKRTTPSWPLRTRRELVQWVDRQTQPLVRTIKTPEDWKQLKERHDHVVLGMGVPRSRLEAHAKDHPNKVFAHNPTSKDIHVLYKRPHEPKALRIDHAKHLHHHLDKHAFEHARACEHEHINNVLEHGRHKGVLMLWNFEDPDHVAEVESGDVVTCVLKAGSPLLQHYGVKGVKRAYIATKGHTFQQEHDDVHAFVDEWRRGNLQPYHKTSEPSLASTGLPRLQAHTHDDVFVSGKNVLVLYHGHSPACRRTEEIAKGVHEAMLGDPTFELHTMNVADEHAHHVSLPHVPAFKLYTSDGRVHDVEGEYSVGNIVRFVKRKNLF